MSEEDDDIGNEFSCNIIEPTQTEVPPKKKKWTPTSLRPPSKDLKVLTDSSMTKAGTSTTFDRKEDVTTTKLENNNNQRKKHFKILYAKNSDDDDDDYDDDDEDDYDDNPEMDIHVSSSESIIIEYEDVPNAYSIGNNGPNPKKVHNENGSQSIGVQCNNIAPSLDCKIPSQGYCPIPDDIDVFAEHLGRQLRSLNSPLTRVTLQKVISTLVYEAKIQELCDGTDSNVSVITPNSTVADEENGDKVPNVNAATPSKPDSDLEASQSLLKTPFQENLPKANTPNNKSDDISVKRSRLSLNHSGKRKNKLSLVK